MHGNQQLCSSFVSDVFILLLFLSLCACCSPTLSVNLLIVNLWFYFHLFLFMLCLLIAGGKFNNKSRRYHTPPNALRDHDCIRFPNRMPPSSLHFHHVPCTVFPLLSYFCNSLSCFPCEQRSPERLRPMDEYAKNTLKGSDLKKKLLN